MKKNITRNGKHDVYTRRAYVAPGVWYILPKTGERLIALGPLDGMRGKHHDLYKRNVITHVHGNTEVLVPAALS